MKIMKLTKPSLQSPLILAAAALSVLLFSPGSQAHAPFDGHWSVQVVANGRDCAVGYVVPIQVSDGRISFGGLFGAVASGRVGADGYLNVRMAHAADVVNATGHLTNTGGSGRWTSPTLQCRGMWAASKG
jgi:hypothetical protein